MIEAAQAKINLCLHVTGQRSDGYHLLDSLVVFCDFGDLVEVAPADDLYLRIVGPLAHALPVADDNLVLRAARAFHCQHGAAITLTKRLPIASGIGGGSADAAATLRVLSRLWTLPLPGPDAILQLGADVPACLWGRPVRMQGIGEVLVPVPPLPAMFVVLVNPGVAVSTPAVFKGLHSKTNPGLALVPAFGSLRAFADWLTLQRNDLEPAATGLDPVIDEVKQALAAQPDCLLARMSGSGATCFGLFASALAATRAKAALQARQPGWWVEAGKIRD